MFKFLKEKITNWAKKISSSKKEEKKDKIEKEEIKEKKESKEIKKDFWKKVKEKISQKKIKISEKEFEEYGEELKMILLENNVAYDVAEKIISELKEEIKDKEFLEKEFEFTVKDLLKETISKVLADPPNLIEEIKSKEKPYIILFLGINGSGKTTTIAKIANFLKNNGFSCVIAAADTFRAASIEQIKEHGQKLGIKVISSNYGADPASVGYDSINYAKKNNINVVLIDSAGRMHTNKNLMKEMEKIVRVCKPNLKIFVGESISGNDVIEQVKSFDWHVGIDGIILTKSDVDEKGGTALSVSYITKKPILFLGTGQNYDDLEIFNKSKFFKSIGLDNEN
ncbi:MAG: signal recognition particle-docking protein FtsY [Candidatus Pacearchaeota archaeon]|nr:MAG: signal recognition particle-docking protein FtsY [Candidatus Pacearchaeota archaeon]